MGARLAAVGRAVSARTRCRHFGRALAGAAALVLLSCAAPEAYRPGAAMNQPVPGAWRNAPESAPDKLGPAPDLRSWWRALNDPELDRLVEHASRSNLTVAQAELRLRAARALAERGATEFRPELSFETYSLPEASSHRSYFVAGFDSRWELGLFGRKRASQQLGAARVGLAEVDSSAAQVSVTAEVVKDYVELRAAQARLAVAEELHAVRRDKASLAEVRLRTLTGSRLDVERAQIELAQSAAALAEPQEALVGAQQALTVLLAESQATSQPDPALSELPATAPQPVPAVAAVGILPADLLRTRPEIKRAELEVLRAGGEFGLAQADLYPKLALGGSLTSSTYLTGDVDRAGKAVLSFGPLIDMPLFDWGARQDSVRASKAGLTAAELAYRESVLQGLAEVETAMARLKQQRARLAESDGALAAAGRTRENVATLRRLGLSDGFEESDAKAALLQARLEQSNARRDLALAYVAMYKALGGSPAGAAAEAAGETH